tara:strand:- start:138 stop:377 length:240 start_codon:yes stop_codon:yes gene_type:complete
MAATGLSKLHSFQGLSPWAISRTVHPKDQISAWVPYFYYLMISGAIQGMLPFISSLKFLLKLVKVLSIYFAQPKSLNLI